MLDSPTQPDEAARRGLLKDRSLESLAVPSGQGR